MVNYPIKSLTLQNFCGIRHLEITPGGGSTSIYGNNATGKTTIANAFLWLFTGKNSAGTSELDPQPLDEQNGKIHNLETSVTVVFEDGSEYRRTLSEVWAKKRGEANEKLTGTKTAYYKDGVPMKEKEFIADIEREFGGADRFRILTIPGCFPTMDWKQRRNILLEMCGDVTDSDVIASDAALAELPEFLGSHSVEDYLKIVKSRKAELKREIDLIPARISENRSTAGDSVETDAAAVEKEIRQLESEEKSLLERLAALDSESPSAVRERELKSRLEEARTRFISEQNTAMEAYSGEIRRLTEAKTSLFSERSPLLVRQTMLPREIECMKSRRAELVKKTAEIRAKQYDGGENCPCCGQKLPPEQFENAIAEFNRRKSEELEKISEEARQSCHKDMIAVAEKELSGLNTAIAELSRRYDEAAALLAEKTASKPAECRFEETEEYRQITAEIKRAESVPRNEAPEAVSVTDDLTAVRNKLHAARERLAEARTVQNIRKRIAELEEQQKQLAAEYAHCEKGEFLCELFTRRKISMLDERINSRFKTLKFKLFHEQQNGGIQEVCKVLIPCESGLVDYEKANNAARINAGLEIIASLSEHYGISLPVFVDNAESVTVLDNIDNQVIRLVVSEADKQLRAEYEA